MRDIIKIITRRLPSFYIDIAALRPGTVGAYALAVVSVGIARGCGSLSIHISTARAGSNLACSAMRLFFGLCAFACARCGREFGAKFPDAVVDEHGTDRRCRNGPLNRPAQGRSSTASARSSQFRRSSSCDGRRATHPSMPIDAGLMLASGIEITFFDIFVLSKVAGI
jgi:hypothetical protein